VAEASLALCQCLTEIRDQSDCSNCLNIFANLAVLAIRTHLALRWTYPVEWGRECAFRASAAMRVYTDEVPSPCLAVPAQTTCLSDARETDVTVEQRIDPLGKQ